MTENTYSCKFCILTSVFFYRHFKLRKAALLFGNFCVILQV